MTLIRVSDGARLGSTLANAEGTFRLAAPAAGVYRVYAERIGYDRMESAEFTLAVGDVHTVALRASVMAIDLNALTVEATARCRPRPGSGPETARLWEEVRKALEVARWSGSQKVLRMAVANRRRELDAHTLRVEGGEEQARLGFYDGSPYRSLPVEELADGGYIQPAPGGTYDYYAPDAGVLLSDEFLDTHCFRVMDAPDDDADLIGLGFEPMPGRAMADIAGTLWVDRGTAELRRVDFRYTNIPDLPGRWSQIGGRVSFHRLANGMWIVDDWYIRMPMSVSRTRTPTGPGDPVLQRLYETGGRVQSVRTLQGELIAEATGATVFGTVIDSVAGAPLAGAVIRLRGTDLEATTGEDGAWRITGAPAGRYTLELQHPLPDLLALPGLGGDLTLEAGQAVRYPLSIPSAASIAEMACREAVPYGAPRFVYGIVRDPTGERVIPGAIIRLTTRGDGREVRSDSTGVYRGCIEAEHADLQIVATLPGRGTEAQQALDVVATDALLRADITLAAAAAAVTSDDRNNGETRYWSNSIIGTITTADGEPVPSAVIELLLEADGEAVGSTVSNERGRFEIRHPDSGDDYILRVTRPGFTPATQAVRFRPGEQLEMDIELHRQIP